LRALITGISGFVGSHLAEYLLEHTDWEVCGTVYGLLDNIAAIRHRLVLYPAELSRLEVVRFIIEDSKPDYIFHLAAQPIPALSRRDPWFTLENNIRAQLNVLEAVAEGGPKRARVLVVGSSEEYGRVSEEALPVAEDAPLNPTTPYAVSKVAQDYLGLQYYLSSSVAAIRVRPFNHIGPRQRLGFVAPDFASQIAQIEGGLRPPHVSVGALDVARDFSDVRDVVRAYFLAITQGEPGEVYNVGSGRAQTTRALLETLVRLSGVKVAIVQDQQRFRPVEASVMVADCRKLEARTGWKPGISFEQSVEDVLDYWREQVRVGATDPTPTALQAMGRET
jgi:GDP-4-dehydro-6-deoxy-D-mannose reductase